MANYIVWKNHVVSMVRGDYFNMKVDLPEELIKTGSKLYFALMYPNKSFEDAILIRSYDIVIPNVENPDVLVPEIILLPDDTVDLAPGIYYYTVKIELPDEKVYTIIPNTIFNIIN